MRYENYCQINIIKFYQTSVENNYYSDLGVKYAQFEPIVRVLAEISSKEHLPVLLINTICRTIYISQSYHLTTV